MADDLQDDNIHREQSLQQPETRTATTPAAITELIAATIAAVSAGAILELKEFLTLADHNGDTEIPVEGSSCIAVLKYNHDSREVTVVFNDGSDYYYPDVPPNLFLEWVNAPSKGSYYNAYVRQRWGGWPIGSTKSKRLL